MARHICSSTQRGNRSSVPTAATAATATETAAIGLVQRVRVVDPASTGLAAGVDPQTLVFRPQAARIPNTQHATDHQQCYCEAEQAEADQ